MKPRRLLSGLLGLAAFSAAAGACLPPNSTALEASRATKPTDTATNEPVQGQPVVSKARKPARAASANTQQRRPNSAAAKRANTQPATNSPGQPAADLTPGAPGSVDRLAADTNVAAGLQKWIDANRPGDNHKSLAFFVGTWDANVSYTNIPTPSHAPQANPGRVVTSWTHGNRFLRSEFSGGAGGPGYTATGTYGFNNAAAAFEGTWMDSMSTGVRVSTGSADAGGKVFTYTSNFTDPVTGSPVTFKEVFTINAPNQYTRQVFEVGANRSEHKLQEVVFTRRN